MTLFAVSCRRPWVTTLIREIGVLAGAKPQFGAAARAKPFQEFVAGKGGSLLSMQPASGIQTEGAPFQGPWSIADPNATGYDTPGYIAGGLQGGVIGSGGAAQAPRQPLTITVDPERVRRWKEAHPGEPLPSLDSSVDAYLTAKQEEARKAAREESESQLHLAQAAKALNPSNPILRQFKEGDQIITKQWNPESRQWEEQSSAPRFKDFQTPTPHYSESNRTDEQGNPLLFNSLTGQYQPAALPGGAHPKQGSTSKPMTALQRAQLWKHYVGSRMDDLLNLSQDWKPNQEDFLAWQKEIGMDSGPTAPSGKVAIPAPSQAVTPGKLVPPPEIKAKIDAEQAATVGRPQAIRGPRIIKTASNPTTGKRIGLGEDGQWYALP